MKIHSNHLSTTICKQIFDWLKFLSRYIFCEERKSFLCENVWHMFEYHFSRSALKNALVNVSGNSTGITFRVFFIKLNVETYDSKLALI